MKTPPLLLGAALLFWGWEADYLVAGAVMAVVLEGARFLKVRWDFSNADFSRIWQVCAVLFLAAIVYAFTSNNGPADFEKLWENPRAEMREAGDSSTKAEASFLRWTPIIFSLFMAAQVYSEKQGVPLAVISLFGRARIKRAAAHGVKLEPKSTDVSYAYFAVCLTAASVHGVDHDRHFFWGLAALLGWSLWTLRPNRYGVLIWGAALTLALALGYGGQRGIGVLQHLIMSYHPDWFSGDTRASFDPSRSRTQLGQIGRMKGSGRIVIRMEPKNGSRAPMYLREASYQTFKSPEWFVGSSRDNFDPLNAYQTNGSTWMLQPEKINNATNTISCYLDWSSEGVPAGLLPLPIGVGRLDNLDAYTLETNKAGAVLAHGPELLVFDACDGPGHVIDSPPSSNDLAGPLSGETEALDQVIEEMHVKGQGTDQALRTVSGFFQNKFTYSTWQRPPRGKWPTSPLNRFLLETRSGHCEYFASATVLILRRLGIPARYAVGYAVHEASGSGYVVRGRDAHAWCLVWHNGNWENFDTTPASWEAEEAKRASALEFLSDLWSSLQYEFTRLKVAWGENRVQGYLPLLAVPVVAVLLYRIVFRRSWRWRKRKQEEQRAAGLLPGSDSEFYELEKTLAQRGLARGASEPMSGWLERAGRDPGLKPLRGPLHEVLRLHYRHRFDPRGLDGTAREELRDRAKSCLAALGQLPLENTK